MVKKLLFSSLILILLGGSIAVIGWIGFQEHFRLLARSFQNEAKDGERQVEEERQEELLRDHQTIETGKEAGLILNDIEGWLRGLESDGLPEE